jgi:hypothetical protein
MPNSDDDVEFRVTELVADHLGLRPDQLSLLTALQEFELSACDIDDMLLRLSAEFNADLSGYKWYYHADPDGWNPLWTIWKPWWRSVEKIPIRVADLVDTARQKHWTIRYPDRVMIARPEYATWVAVTLLLIVMGVGLARCSADR